MYAKFVKTVEIITGSYTNSVSKLISHLIHRSTLFFKLLYYKPASIALQTEKTEGF